MNRAPHSVYASSAAERWEAGEGEDPGLGGGHPDGLDVFRGVQGSFEVTCDQVVDGQILID